MRGWSLGWLACVRFFLSVITLSFLHSADTSQGIGSTVGPLDSRCIIYAWTGVEGLQDRSLFLMIPHFSHSLTHGGCAFWQYGNRGGTVLDHVRDTTAYTLIK